MALESQRFVTGGIHGVSCYHRACRSSSPQRLPLIAIRRPSRIDHMRQNSGTARHSVGTPVISA